MPAPYCELDCLLHDHGDGAHPLSVIISKLRLMAGLEVDLRKDYPSIYKRNFIGVHANIIEAFSHLNSLLQGRDALYLAAQNHVAIRARQGIYYDEVMFAPQYYCAGGLSPKEVAEAIIEGIKHGEKEYPETEVNLLFAIGRELESSQAIELLKVLEKCDRNYVVGANIVCDESAFSPERHIETVKYADSAGINLEFHASEWVRHYGQLPDFQRDLPGLKNNLRIVLKLFKNFRSEAKKRVGHGIALPYDPELMQIAVDHEIGITGCPGSNLQGKNIPDLESLKIREMLERKVLWSMHPDDDFFQPNINEVYQSCNDIYRFSVDEKKLLRCNAWLSRFGYRKVHERDQSMGA